MVYKSLAVYIGRHLLSL